jgi:hypothetical protein
MKGRAREADLQHLARRRFPCGRQTELRHTQSPAAYWTFTVAVSLMSLDESPIIT